MTAFCWRRRPVLFTATRLTLRRIPGELEKCPAAYQPCADGGIEIFAGFGQVGRELGQGSGIRDNNGRPARRGVPPPF